ncbi:cell division protein FtsL [Buchnera aphidicola]|jgi:cell division protein FtsL|uniref:Cell division protein FtsL n=1 Tax=Buchnera aphidicola subsp. Schizaphis graminum (strain Sg) TaxID=198804 RepID=FTSL_BUCAP|nr:cell division protein FtsL [Buchnera aphidicola]O85296.1 RecName: Full=Cell division protein FtsL [Buchnera aphidicola str. Sg (Schizaphis graminum)]AAC32336.1 cell division protein [Buchnera aphidicola]AAM67777.1 cell division protein [Buchnera aphidicola str. Sg (Schizaphis graminum)]AWI49726.1 cell division protein FtsL [Buchnera aphidicola (Schizaphis graminum)]
MKIKRYDLPKIIKKDFFIYGKIHLILLLAIILSANSVVIVVYNTRLLIAEEENLNLKTKKKDDEWRNLIIEKNAISMPSIH